MALLLVAVTGAGLLYWLHQKPISLDQYKSFLADDLSEAFGGRDVRISNLRFGFPPNASFPVLTADRLDVLGDGGRSLFGADDITLGVKFSELLLGRVDLSDLSLGEVRLPISLADGTDQTRGFMQRLDGLFETLQELLNDDVGAGLDGIALDRLVLAGRFPSARGQAGPPPRRHQPHSLARQQPIQTKLVSCNFHRALTVDWAVSILLYIGESLQIGRTTAAFQARQWTGARPWPTRITRSSSAGGHSGLIACLQAS